MRNDHAELWPRPKGVRSAGTLRRRKARAVRRYGTPGRYEGGRRPTSEAICKIADAYPAAANGGVTGDKGGRWYRVMPLFFLPPPRGNIR